MEDQKVSEQDMQVDQQPQPEEVEESKQQETDKEEEQVCKLLNYSLLRMLLRFLNIS